MSLRVFPTMHTFHPVEEDGTIPLTSRPRTKISLMQKDPALDAGEQIDLETLRKAETGILVQGEAMAIPKK